MRPRLLPLLSALTLFIGLASADETGGCKMAGTIFTIDPLGGTLILKDATGYLKNVPVPSGTAISKLPVTAGGATSSIRPADLNNGDIVCVDASTPPKLSVVSRQDVHRAQADFIVGWQQNSLYGNISAIDIAGRSLMVKPLPPSTGDSPVRISLPTSVQLKTAPPNARRISEAVSFQLEDLKPGDPVYVRGSRSASGSEIAASLILKDGYRGILGSLIEVQVLASVLRIREFGTGRTLDMKMTPNQVYRTTENITHPMRVETASGVLLAPVGLADLQSGDAILVIGKTAGEGSAGEGLAAVMKFGTFGVLPQDPQNSVSWFIAK
ncbi:MAG TPA: hypothetical protein VEX68_06965 [Bryobacteraceae bacterium]|nr:hypothetical protein [Bryobacteraceae bacterium]